MMMMVMVMMMVPSMLMVLVTMIMTMVTMILNMIKTNTAFLFRHLAVCWHVESRGMRHFQLSLCKFLCLGLSANQLVSGFCHS